jgi:hypothetical protein
MFGSVAARAAKFIPMPTIADVRAWGPAISTGAMARLYGMTKLSSEVRQGGSYVGRPIGIEILVLQPWHDGSEFRRGWRECNTVAQIDATIAERKELGPKEVVAAKTTKVNVRSNENRLQALLPPRR